jgi:hypothetical protein
MKWFSIFLLAAFPATIHARHLRNTPEDVAFLVVSATEDISVCLQSTIIYTDDHAEPLRDGTMAIESSDGYTVTFSITQTWKSPDSISWIAPAYAQDGKDMFCNEADKLESVVPNFKKSYTADCLNGKASIDLFVHDGSFKSSSQQNYRSCNGWGNDNGIATYKFEVSCDGTEICEDGSPSSPTLAPTHGPTSNPTNGPTSIPTSSPTNGPTSIPISTEAETIPQIITNLSEITSESSGSLGDPHCKSNQTALPDLTYSFNAHYFSLTSIPSLSTHSQNLEG